jgi:isopenicillin N synthase-like dioxygenase
MVGLVDAPHQDYSSAPAAGKHFAPNIWPERPAELRQVCNAEGEWVDVPIVPDCFIINIGDLLARWTNDTWVSTLHRVVNPPANLGPETRRQSLVFFHNPNYDAAISNLVPDTTAKYPPTTSGAHLRSLYTATQNT